MIQMLKITIDNNLIAEVPILIYDPERAKRIIDGNLPSIIANFGPLGTESLIKAINAGLEKGAQGEYAGLWLELTTPTPVVEVPHDPNHGRDVRPQMPADWTPTNN